MTGYQEPIMQWRCMDWLSIPRILGLRGTPVTTPEVVKP